MNRTTCLTIACVLAASVAFAQGTDRAQGLQRGYNRVKGLVMGSANEMPEAGYSHRPAEGIRNFGQLFGHIADFHYQVCSQARGVENPQQGQDNLETRLESSSKADVIAALQASYDFCDPAFDSLTEATASEMLQGGRGGPTARGAVLAQVVEHDNEMYGVSTVYLRTNDQVPPASQGRRGGGPGRGGRGQ